MQQMLISTKTQTIEFPIPQYDIKASIFLKNYHQKLKRQRKKQQKLNSLKHIQQNHPLNSHPNFQSSHHNTIPINKTTISTSNSIIVNKTPPITSRNNTIRSSSSIGSQILVFKKTPFLDTSTQKLARKNYRNDSTLQVLLKEIYQIKQEQNEEIQKLKKNRINSIDYEREKKTRRDSSLQGYLNKQEKGFSLPSSKRRFLINGTITQSPLERQLNGTLTSRLQSKLLMTANDRRTLMNRQRSKQKTNRVKLQRFDNFKSIEPWEIQHLNYNSHRSYQQNGYFMQQMESLYD